MNKAVRWFWGAKNDRMTKKKNISPWRLEMHIQAIKSSIVSLQLNILVCCEEIWLAANCCFMGISLSGVQCNLL